MIERIEDKAVKLSRQLIVYHMYQPLLTTSDP